MQTSAKGYNVIRSFEGRALRAYQDSVGVWTIGYGNTNYDANAVAKLGKIQQGLTITEDQAESLLVESIQTGYEPAVRKRLGTNVSQGAFDAGVSFHYNTGAIAKASWPSALLRGDLPTVHTSIMAWNKAGGNVLAGLTRRRNREWMMIQSGDYGPEGSSGPVEIGENGRPTGKKLPAPGPVAPGTPSTPPGPGMLALHDTGPEVAELQKQLKQLKLYDGQVNSIFDDATHVAVVSFQKAHPNLTADGIVGPATRNSILRELKARKNAGNITKTVAGATVSTVAAGGTLGAKVATFLAISAGVAVVVAGVYLAWRYRAEIASFVNRLLGREVA
jgi:lysozyme